MKKKRIGVPFSGEHIGGSRVSTMLLPQGLDPAASEPVDFLRKRSIPFIIEPIAAMKSWEGSPWKRLLASFQFLLPTIRLIRKHDLDLIHVQDHKAFQLWVWGGFLMRRPMLLHWRASYGKTIVTRIMMWFATRIIVISRYLQSCLPEEIGRRAALIYNPFDTEEPLPGRKTCRSALRAELDPPADSVVLGWIGTINKRKRPESFSIARHVRAVEAAYRSLLDPSDQSLSPRQIGKTAAG